MIPKSLEEKLYELLSFEKNLKEESVELSSQYKEGIFSLSSSRIKAYLAARFPATFAALVRVFSEISPFFSPSSILDLGAGPGTGWWAAQEVWKRAISYACLEKEKGFIEWGKKLGCNAEWFLQDMTTVETFSAHDLVLFSYSLGEIKEKENLLLRAWKATKEALVILEPGTPAGYQTILLARKLLLQEGGYILAPCPHAKKCPCPQWCHFSIRLHRSKIHRETKNAFVSYEDEKFSYLVMTKEKKPLEGDRVMHVPMKRSGHILLDLCTKQGNYERITITKKDQEKYKRAKKVKWGDLF